MVHDAGRVKWMVEIEKIYEPKSRSRRSHTRKYNEGEKIASCWRKTDAVYLSSMKFCRDEQCSVGMRTFEMRSFEDSVACALVLG